MPRSGFDLYLSIDDGFDYARPADLRPAAYWAIDTHLDSPRSLRRAENFDFVFAAQRDGAERLRAAGIESARWLPLACDPELHRPHEVPKRFDVAFVGHLPPGPRSDLARLLRRHFHQSFFGQAYFDEMAAIYSAARTAFNRSVRSDVNMRVFEAAACGTLLLTNDLTHNGQAELLRDGVHLATYRDGEELLDKLRYYLRREALRERIAAAGRAEVVEKHTYRQRMEEILKMVAGGGRERPSVGNGLLAVPPSAECGDGRVGRAQRVPPSAGLNPSSQRRLETVGLASSAHPTVAPENSATAAGGCATEASGMDGLGSPSSERDGLGSPSSGAAERHRGRSLQNANGCEGHDAAYFDFARPEVLSLVPQSAERVLEVGCGAGRLGESLKQRQRCEVTGIERDRAAAARAAERLDRVYAGNVERRELPFAAGSFDCIVCGDVLEHLARPQAFLQRARGWLAEGGVLVASIPNVRHHSVVSGLLAGNWTYEPSGLLDRTHRHFLTRRDIEVLFSAAGYQMTRLDVVPGPGHEEWRLQGCRGELHLGGLAVSGLSRDEAEEFFAYQYLVVAELQSATEDVRNDGRVGRVKRVPPSGASEPTPT